MFTRFNLDVLTMAGDVNPAFNFGFSVFDFSGFAFGFFAGLYGVLELWPYFAFYGVLAFGLVLYYRRPVFSYALLNSRETIFFYRVLIYRPAAGINAGLWPATLFGLVYAFWAGFPLSKFE